MSLNAKLSELGLKHRQGVPFAKLGYWRVGGPIDHLVEIHTIEELILLVRLGEPISVLGNGSNMLVADAGIRGISIQLKGALAESEFQENTVCCGAGLKNIILLNRMKKKKLGGLGCLAGVPGTIGGALRMNAGTYLGEIGEKTLWVEWVDPKGEIHVYRQEQMGFAYRKSTQLPWTGIVTRAAFQLDALNFSNESEKIEHHLLRRKETQPLNLPSCGSVFTNPKGDHAGRLIEAAGLKGHVIGGASISSKHANFIVNNGGATAMDIYHLISLAKERVATLFDVELEPEVKPMGQWGKGLWPI